MGAPIALSPATTACSHPPTKLQKIAAQKQKGRVTAEFPASYAASKCFCSCSKLWLLQEKGAGFLALKLHDLIYIVGNFPKPR
jgi:hypothetical protein